MRESIQEKKLKALRRAQFSLKQRFERIEWEEEELIPEIIKFKSMATLPELAEVTGGELVVEFSVEEC